MRLRGVRLTDSGRLVRMTAGKVVNLAPMNINAYHFWNGARPKEAAPCGLPLLVFIEDSFAYIMCWNLIIQT